jgi:hypothetical protein
MKFNLRLNAADLAKLAKRDDSDAELGAVSMPINENGALDADNQLGCADSGLHPGQIFGNRD